MASLFGEDWQAELAAARTRAASHDNRIADQGAEVSSPSEGRLTDRRRSKGLEIAEADQTKRRRETP